MEKPFEFKVGQVYKARTGELLQLMKLDDETGTFQLLDPKTKEPSAFYLEGPRASMQDMATEMGLTVIEDLAAYKPSGLILIH